ncbi:peptidase domain-containing ABC transporter [Nocardioides hwasunensis]|uniref:peptidase domain-containing ABC transporter n=1 Tax=Nocardioides hwasunensis TaxID=397258 RepID=UPI0029647906|nr:ATP-binding cassette domain-containing protein [Nocardioides hwasunensis]
MQQRVATDCGVAALASAMSCYGVRRSVGRMWQLYGRSNTAMSLLELQQVAAANGFTARCFEFERLAEVSSSYFPAVVHLEQSGGHFVTIDRRIGAWVRCSDPAETQSWVRHDRLATSGYLMTVEPSGSDEIASDPSGASILARLLRGARGRLVVIALLSIVATIAGLAVSQFVRVLVDLVTAEAADLATLLVLGAGTVVVSALGTAASYASMRRAFTSSVGMERDLAVGYADTVVSLRGTAFRSYSPGDLMARFSDLSEMRAFVHDSLLSGILSSITFLGASLVLGLQSPLLALMCMTGVAVVAAARWWGGRRIEGLQRRSAAAESQLTQAMVEMVEGSVSNRGSAWRDYQTPRLASAFDGLITRTRRVFLSSSMLETAAGLAGTVILVVCMVVAALQVQSGALTLGSLASLAVLLPMMSTAAFTLVGLQQDVQRATVSAERIEEISFATARSAESSPERTVDGVRDSGAGEHVIHLRDVEVRAAGARLAHLPELWIDRGEVVGLRGPNGSGKSTICRVLAGMEDEWSGEVWIDGEAMHDVESPDWERHVGYVPDSVVVTADTLVGNIGFGREVPRLDEICTAVGLGTLAGRLPLGYATPIGPPHVRLSGGEGQRLGIARALAGRPTVLVLDEATRMLDVQTQRRIVDTIVERDLCDAVLLVSHSESLESLVSRVVEMEVT